MKLGIILESFAIRSATLLSPGLLCLAGCYCDTGTGGGYGVTVSGSASANGCIDWYTYDDDWHRRHCNDPGYVWCNAPNGGLGATPSYDSGVTSGETVDSGATSSAMPDGALPTADSGSGGQASDSGSAAADGGAGSTGDAGDGAVLGACTTSASCAVGSSCVGGSCQPCSGGVCVCQRDDDCSASQICDHTTSVCVAPPPACTALTTEAACTARADCSPIYGGMSCTNNVGSECHSGEANCTCATYSFAACVTHAM
jgi:hypothetical protein